METQRPRLGVEYLQGERVATLRSPAQGQRLVPGRLGGKQQLVPRMTGRKRVEILGKPGNRGVGFHAAPVPPAPATKRGDPAELFVEQLERHGHMARLHAREMVARERQTVGVDIYGAKTGTGRQHEHGGAGVAADPRRLAHAAQIAVVAREKRDRTTGRPRQRGGIIGVKIPAGERIGQIGRFLQDTIGAVRPGKGQPGRRDTIPREAVLRQEALRPLDPPGDDGCGAQLRVGRTLAQFERDRLAVREHSAGLGGGGAGIGAEINITSDGGHGRKTRGCAAGRIAENARRPAPARRRPESARHRSENLAMRPGGEADDAAAAWNRRRVRVRRTRKRKRDRGLVRARRSSDLGGRPATPSRFINKSNSHFPLVIYH